MESLFRENSVKCTQNISMTCSDRDTGRWQYKNIKNFFKPVQGTSGHLFQQEY